MLQDIDCPEDPIPYIEKVETYVAYKQRKSGKYDVELIDHYSLDDCHEGMDNDKLSVTEDDSDKDWQIVDTHQSRLRQAQKYSEMCHHKFNCKFGSKCDKKHTDAEKQYFRKNMGKGNPLRKLGPCTYFEQSRCRKVAEECKWAHGEADAWCLICCEQGHYTDNCPSKA